MEKGTVDVDDKDLTTKVELPSITAKNTDETKTDVIEISSEKLGEMLKDEYYNNVTGEYVYTENVDGKEYTYKVKKTENTKPLTHAQLADRLGEGFTGDDNGVYYKGEKLNLDQMEAVRKTLSYTVEVTEVTKTPGQVEGGQESIKSAEETAKLEAIKAALTDAAKNHVFDYTFVDNENLGSITRLEGFLFPDTYEFFHKEDAVSALDRLLSNFQTRVSGELLTDIENSQYSLREIVTLASIIEKEAIGDDEERANISSVFYTRLSGDNSEIGTALQSDATIYNALHIAGMDDTQFSTDLDSPYNTYKHGGLPAGPICNPSLSSIKAAVHPNDTGYYYFAYGKDGVSHFFRTYDEHLAFVNSDMYAPD